MDRPVGRKQTDWAQVAMNPRFVELHRRKVKFLFGWWIASTVIYVVFLVCASLVSRLFAWRVMGDINFGYLCVLSLFVYCWIVAGYYASWANRVSDKITTELVEGFKKGGIEK